MDSYIVYQRGWPQLAWIAILVFQNHVQHENIAVGLLSLLIDKLFFGQSKSNSVQHMNPNLASHLFTKLPVA